MNHKNEKCEFWKEFVGIGMQTIPNWNLEKNMPCPLHHNHSIILCISASWNLLLLMTKIQHSPQPICFQWKNSPNSIRKCKVQSKQNFHRLSLTENREASFRTPPQQNVEYFTLMCYFLCYCLLSWFAFTYSQMSIFLTGTMQERLRSWQWQGKSIGVKEL